MLFSLNLLSKVQFSSFVKKMAENLTRSTAGLKQGNAMIDKYAIEMEAKLKQRSSVQSSIEGLENEMKK